MQQILALPDGKTVRTVLHGAGATVGVVVSEVLPTGACLRSLLLLPPPGRVAC